METASKVGSFKNKTAAPLSYLQKNSSSRIRFLLDTNNIIKLCLFTFCCSYNVSFLNFLLM